MTGFGLGRGAITREWRIYVMWNVKIYIVQQTVLRILKN